jgi:hypothetical protein
MMDQTDRSSRGVEGGTETPLARGRADAVGAAITPASWEFTLKYCGAKRVRCGPTFLAALAFFGLSICTHSPAVAVDLPSIAVTGTSAATVFRYTIDACSPEDIPDAPARAFRDATGNVHLFATHYINRQMIGRSLVDLMHHCDVVFEGADDPRPENINNREWLASFFTRDGQSIMAIIHNEYHGIFWPNGCWTMTWTDCWFNSLRFAMSSDGGFHFQQAPVLAAPNGPYATTQVGPFGFFNPTNIVRNPVDGYYYAIIFAADPTLDLAGSCLIRTADPANYASWRAWDGTGFAVQLPTTYQQQRITDRSCTALSRWFISSLVRHEPTGIFIALFATVSGNERGMFYALSSDLFRWTTPKLFYAAPSGCPNRNEITYPSILDPVSKSVIFDTIGDTAQLFFTHTNLDNCQETLNQDLLRISISVTH